MSLICLINKSVPREASMDITIEGTTTGVMLNGKKPNGLENLFEELREMQCAHFVSDGSWSMYELLAYALDRFSGACDVWLTTYSMTELSARIIAKLKDSGKIKDLHLLMDYKSKMRYPQVDQLIRNVATSIGLTQLHAKVLVITNGKCFLTIVGSANWTKNPRIEVGVIDQHPDIALEHIEWISKKIADASTH